MRNCEEEIVVKRSAIPTADKTPDMEVRMRKLVAKFVLFTFLVGYITPPAYAAPSAEEQQASLSPGDGNDKRMEKKFITDPRAPGLKIPVREPLPVPELPGLSWDVYGLNPMITPDLLPVGSGEGNELIDLQALQDVFAGTDSTGKLTPEQLSTRNTYLMAGLAHVAFRRTDGVVPAWFLDEVRAKVFDPTRVFKQEFRKGFLFWPCGMAFSRLVRDLKTGQTQRIVTFGGNAKVNFDEKLEVWMLEPIYMRQGPYEGHWLSIVIPTKCFNITCMSAEAPTAAILPEMAKEEQTRTPLADAAAAGFTGPQGPQGPQGPEGRPGKDSKPLWKDWKFWVPVGAGIGLGLWALSRQRTVVQPRTKGTASNGGSAQFTAGALTAPACTTTPVVQFCFGGGDDE